MATEGFPGGAGGRELQRTLAQGEPVLAWASGKAGALLIATDRRAIIIKTGSAATGAWFGKKIASFGYGQITSIDLHTGVFDGYVEISAGGVQNRNLNRIAQLVHADNICPFFKSAEASFRHVVDSIRQWLYAPPAHAPGAPRPVPAPMPQPQPQPSIPEQIAALARLRDAGAITPAEYEAKKTDLLNRM